MFSAADERALLARLVTLTGGDITMVDRVTFCGPAEVLPSVYAVTSFAAASVATATLAVAGLHARRNGRPVADVEVDRTLACAAFRYESLFSPVGWELPALWDPVAGDYRARDGWIRLHTNYANHRAAALGVLGAEADRGAVARAVAGWDAEALEQSVVDAGGCAAAMSTTTAWASGAVAQAVAAAPPIAVTRTDPQGARLGKRGGTRPLDGVRVLDLTRVIAGPTCTRMLAAYGADVLRVDPPGFAEVPALVPETTAGKRCCALDLAEPSARSRFEALVAEADVVVHGLRPGALARFGFDKDSLRRIHPGLVTVALNAYGWVGPWRYRRGFDSLVQMSTGIAARGAELSGADHPVSLPAQALDHATGHLLAAATCNALARSLDDGAGTDVRASLVGTASLLIDCGEHGRPDGQPAWPDAVFDPATTAWGPARRVRVPGAIDGCPPRLDVDAGPLGRHEAAFAALAGGSTRISPVENR
ncbi:MAG TPA: CoA transferase [Acidimicrobiales bacterium]|nr:CoA transferase [Acidimicrobiales bacterium]